MMGLETLLALQVVMGAGGSLLSGVQGWGAARYNAAVAGQEAEVARAGAAMEAGRIRREGRRVLGSQRVAAAASGVDVGAGSPLLVMLDTIQQTAEDASLATYKGAVKATGLEAEARAQRRAGRQALLGGLLGAGKAGLEYGVRRSIYKKKGLL